MTVLLLNLFNANAQNGSNWVDSDVQQFARNGSWCWFQDERSVIDTVKNKLIVSSANMSSGIDLAIFDLENMEYEGSKRFGGLQYSDDHNSPAVMVAPNGNYIALWAHHYDSKHHYSIYSNGNWSNERSIEWRNWSGGQDYDVAYSNPYYLSVEERIYNFSRVFNVRSPHFVYSDDSGNSWEFGGMLTTHDVVDTYNRGYYKYWGNGVDRIDICCTEEHPRDHTTSIYHGYIQKQKLYDSFGEVADDDIYDGENVPSFESLTKVFAHGTKIDGVEMGRCWQLDICSYDNGIIVILLETRADDAIDDHRNFYARFDGEEWNITYLGKAGTYIYGNEYDYTGLGSVNPNDPNRIYLSTAYNPGDDDVPPSSKREIWRGTSKDEGKTWEWEPVTANTSKDNWRPIVPKWIPGKEALLWFRGDYISAQNVQTEVVGTFYEYDYIPPVVIRKNRVRKTKNLIGKPFTCMATPAGINVHYELPEQTVSILKLFSLSGKQVVAPVNLKTTSEGALTISWKKTAICSGMYLVQLSSGNNTFSTLVNIER